MRRPGVRALLVATGLALVGFYAAVAYLGVRLLATHPPTDERVRRLRRRAATDGRRVPPE